MTLLAVDTHDSPIGRLTIAASERGITRASLRPGPARPGTPVQRSWLDLARRELDAYAEGALTRFTVPVDLRGVPDESRRVLEALADIGPGETVTYGALAARLGDPGWEGARRVGAALARNPVLVVVACHRVVGAGGRLTGYAGDLAAKRTLLDLERGVVPLLTPARGPVWPGGRPAA